MHIFSKTTNDVGVLKQTGKHQQYISNGFTLSLQKELNTFLNELFNATLADHATRECVALNNISKSFGRPIIRTHWKILQCWRYWRLATHSSGAYKILERRPCIQILVKCRRPSSLVSVVSSAMVIMHQLRGHVQVVSMTKRIKHHAILCRHRWKSTNRAHAARCYYQRFTEAENRSFSLRHSVLRQTQTDYAQRRTNEQHI